LFCIREIRARYFAINEYSYHLFNNLPTPTFIVDINTGKIRFVNKASIECYGYSEEEFLLMTLNDIKVEEGQNILSEEFKTINPGNRKATVYAHKKRNGQIITVEVLSNKVTFNNKQCDLVVLQNIKEITSVENEKRDSLDEIIMSPNFASYILQNFPVDVAVFDKDHRYLLLNKIAVRDDEMRKWMIGKDDFDYFARKGSDMTVAKQRRERFLQATDGNGTEWIDEHMVDGQVKYVLRKYLPYKEDGNLKYVYGYGLDITEIRKVQLEREEYLKQLEKIAFTTSHEIRQPICNLKGLISLLDGEELKCQTIVEIINSMKQSVIVMDNYTRDLGAKLHDFKQNLSANKNGN